jgi:inosose dehydratase
MTIKFGVSPIAWINDDMPELGGNTPVETIFRDAHDLGFDGVELGGKFSRDAKILKKDLSRYGLQLVGGWYSTHLLEHSAEEEIGAMQTHLSLLRAMGCDVFIAAECSRAIHGQRGIPLKSSPRLVASEWPAFANRLNAVASYVANEGFRFAYHFHLGTVVEREEDIAQFIKHTDDSVGFVVDTGHAALGGIDAVHLIRNHPKRIVHVHTKDVRRATFERIYRGNESFLNGVLEGMFTAPGDGDLDFAPVLQALSDIHYAGWIVIEAEQDPKKAAPKHYSEIGLKTLRQLAADTGLLSASSTQGAR